MVFQFRSFIRACKKLNTLNISTCSTPMAAKHGKVMTYREGLPPLKSHEVTLQTENNKSSLTPESHDLLWLRGKLNTIISPLAEDLWTLN